MVAINFQKQFADKVESGRKTQTVRQEWKNGKVPWTTGGRLQLYTGMRTKACRKLGDAVCTKVLPVEINDLGVRLNGRLLGFRGPEDDFARDDGFTDLTDMLNWIEGNHGTRVFEGWLIKWRDVK